MLSWMTGGKTDKNPRPASDDAFVARSHDVSLESQLISQAVFDEVENFFDEESDIHNNGKRKAQTTTKTAVFAKEEMKEIELLFKQDFEKRTGRHQMP